MWKWTDLEESELDGLLKVLSNPTRRKILMKLVQEKHYPLQLSKELRISQQSITKHLKVLEQHGVVECISMPSDEGPPRKLYRTTRNFTLTISMDPKMFDARAHEPGSSFTIKICEEVREIEGRFKGVLHTQNYKDRVQKIGRLLEMTEEEIDELDQRRAMLLHLKSKMLKEAYSLIAELYPDYNHRAILYLLLENPDLDTGAISRLLNMTEHEVGEVLDHLISDGVFRIGTRKARRKGGNHGQKGSRTRVTIRRMR